METNNNRESGQQLKSGTVVYAAGLRQYNKSGCCSTMRKYSEDED